ncbi:polysaccharide ABC transporter ATP-binding protein [Nodularia spumigena]|uniref:ABC transporter ATP-binding protein n=1 Tax=Nodularia spumigena TaxID=70799 RepID=UPI0023312BCF|nr:polysaccharide ABC transporter ATP-binding protein [Nodularia spumigena]MDB9347428.1 polysaccharide ABC transporter ATP-binding protein [Nodularia spumigena CS-588/01]MDB9354474.1 polysaccharide ABC transporter ATP-binding protein [Nodularia spumigena CS-588/05]
MSDTVIRVENLGKKYIIGHQQQERYTALRDVITNKVKSLGSLINPQAKAENPAFEEFWALKDVSFDIKQGDRVGIIGRNGAGKSTLLKILSRITEPTTGSIKIKGRVASLLEVGTGFHPELTGRENIFLNGAILGMGKEEITRKFDEIVAFAEVEKFLDTPVKRYSSGMYVRLAFAVAAHLEPEILIVDEVLAVGDAAFQKKCLGKMEHVAKEGRTILFVSHNMAAIQKLCDFCIYLSQGKQEFIGKIAEGINYYVSSSNNINFIKTKENEYGVAIQNIFLQDFLSKEKCLSLVFNNSYELILQIRASQSLPKIAIGLCIYNSYGILISNICTPEEGIDYFLLQEVMQFVFYIPSIQLMPGNYYISLIVRSDDMIYLENDRVMNFEILPNILKQSSRAYRNDHGIIRIVNNIKVEKYH